MVYNTFAFAPRQGIHRSVALWYKQHRRVRNGTAEDPALYPVIAQHFERAGEFVPAADYWQRSGKEAGLGGNHHEALLAYESALKIGVRRSQSRLI